MGEPKHRSGVATARPAGAAPPREVALVTYRNSGGVPAEDQVLAAAFRRRGLGVSHPIWDDSDVVWGQFGLVVVRSTWDYHRDRPGFLRWVQRVRRVTSVWNPPDVLRWNTDKHYLRDLERSGVPVVPTVWAPAGQPPALAKTMDDRRWKVVVVKPAISAAGDRTVRVVRADAARGQRHLEAICEGGTAMVQPYYRSVGSTGERSLVYLDGRYSHSVRRNPLFRGTGRTRPERLTEASRSMRTVARRALNSCPPGLLYARVDLVRDDDGGWKVLEVELTEPSLFFVPCPSAADRMVRGILRRLLR